MPYNCHRNYVCQQQSVCHIIYHLTLFLFLLLAISTAVTHCPHPLLISCLFFVQERDTQIDAEIELIGKAVDELGK